ncbi:hypothetical protein ACFQ1L_28215 [Phytohabitans flavus]|uniref:hypothetical protein n=1 Tax=Phytohabitans flavus TaxID=1076124 RepID=UPI0036415E2B
MGRPAARTDSTSTARRRSPQRAGWVARTSSTAPPRWRAASPAMRPSTAAITRGTGSSCSASSTTPSSMRRLGLGSKRAGSSRAVRSASRPTSSLPSGLR